MPLLDPARHAGALLEPQRLPEHASCSQLVHLQEASAQRGCSCTPLPGAQAAAARQLSWHCAAWSRRWCSCAHAPWDGRPQLRGCRACPCAAWRIHKGHRHSPSSCRGCCALCGAPAGISSSCDWHGSCAARSPARQHSAARPGSAATGQCQGAGSQRACCCGPGAAWAPAAARARAAGASVNDTSRSAFCGPHCALPEPQPGHLLRQGTRSPCPAEAVPAAAAAMPLWQPLLACSCCRLNVLTQALQRCMAQLTQRGVCRLSEGPAAPCGSYCGPG